jgi:cobalamin biosynthesis protein CobT
MALLDSNDLALLRKLQNNLKIRYLKRVAHAHARARACAKSSFSTIRTIRRKREQSRTSGGKAVNLATETRRNSSLLAKKKAKKKPSKKKPAPQPDVESDRARIVKQSTGN